MRLCKFWLKCTVCTPFFFSLYCRILISHWQLHFYRRVNKWLVLKSLDFGVFFWGEGCPSNLRAVKKFTAQNPRPSIVDENLPFVAWLVELTYPIEDDRVVFKRSFLRIVLIIDHQLSHRLNLSDANDLKTLIAVISKR